MSLTFQPIGHHPAAIGQKFHDNLWLKKIEPNHTFKIVWFARNT